MSNDYNGYSELFVYVPYKLKNGVSGVGIERACGFVAKKYLGVCCKRAGDGYSLLLTARKLSGIRFCFIRQADEFQKFRRAGFGFFFRYACELHRKAYVFQAVFLHEQIEPLKYHRYASSGFS